MAVEDAAALAIAVSSNLSIEDALKAYEKVRLPRTTAISAGADNNRNIFHMPDGPGQQARDEMVKKTRGQVSNIFDMAWKYDAVEEMRKEIGTKASI
jgi:salicylate hydroxylase